MCFAVGDRVRVKRSVAWPQGATGVVSQPPGLVVEVARSDWPWTGHVRVTHGPNGSVQLHWVVFDQPEYDGDGDGPYAAAEIELAELESI